MRRIHGPNLARSAFTLIEVMVTAFVMLIVVFAVTTFVIICTRSYAELSRNSLSEYANTRVLDHVASAADGASLARVYRSFGNRTQVGAGLDSAGEFAVLIHLHQSPPGQLLSVSRLVMFFVDRSRPANPVLREMSRDFALDEFRVTSAGFDSEMAVMLEQLLPVAGGGTQGSMLADLDRLMVRKFDTGSAWYPFSVFGNGLYFSISIPVSGGVSPKYDALALTTANFKLR